MMLPVSHVVPVLLALCVVGAAAYYEHGDVETIADGSFEEERPYLLQRLSSDEGRRAGEGGGWEAAPDPRLYVLTEGGDEHDYDDNDQMQTALQPGAKQRVKRHGPSLSVGNSLDVLRQRLLLEFARRRMLQSENQILANREILKSIGKRDVSAHAAHAAQADQGSHGAFRERAPATRDFTKGARTNSASSYSVNRGTHQHHL